MSTKVKRATFAAVLGVSLRTPLKPAGKGTRNPESHSHRLNPRPKIERPDLPSGLFAFGDAEMEHVLKRLFTGRAIPGWFLVVWGMVEVIHTLDFVTQIVAWIYSHRFWTWVTSPLGNTVILLFGFGWLFVVLVRKGKADTRQTPALNASSQGTDEELLNLKKKAIFISPSMAAGAVSFSGKKNKVTVEFFLLSFTTIFTEYIEVKIRSDTSDLLKFTTRQKFPSYPPNTARLVLEHTVVDADHRENLEKFFNTTTPDTPVNVELHIEFEGPEIGHLTFTRILRTLLFVT